MWAKCNKCKHKQQGIIEQMKKHTNVGESKDDSKLKKINIKNY